MFVAGSLNTLQKNPILWDLDGNFSPPKRIVNLLNDILNLLDSSTDYRDFAPTKKPDNGSKKDASHRLRLIHDELFLDYKINRCIGTIYRSMSILSCPILATGKEAVYLETHGEHALPINLLTRMVWHRNTLKKFNPATLLAFIVERTCVCQISKDEEKHIRYKRTIGGEVSSWTRKHPCIIKDPLDNIFFTDIEGNKTDESEILLFARYYNTDINIFHLNEEKFERININTYKLSDHIKSIRKIYNIPFFEL